MDIKLTFLLLSLLITSESCFADPIQDRAKAAFESVTSNFNSKDALNENYAQPLITDDKSMQSLDGTESFSARVGCKSDNNYLSLIASFNAFGKASAQIAIDSNLDGSLDQYSYFSDISVVCANGFKQCTDGANNCQTYKWFASPNVNALKMNTPDEIASVYSCYCINNDCVNLSSENKEEIIRTLGNGVASSLQQHNPYYTISSVNSSAGALNFYGQDTVSCNSTPTPDVHTYKTNSDQLIVDGNNATSNDKYIMVDNIISDMGGASTLNPCSISRNYSFLTGIEEKSNILNVFAQGRDYINCDYSLATGDVNCVTDGDTHKAEIDKTWNVNDLCVSGTSVSKTSDFNYLPSIGWGKSDTTIKVTHLQSPSCANGFEGKIELRDLHSSPDLNWYLSQRIFFTLKKPICTLEEFISNTCSTYENNTSCILEKEKVDGVTTISSMVSTGLIPLPSSKIIDGSSCSETVTRDYFLKERDYRCDSSTSQLTIDTSGFIKPTVSGSDVSINIGGSTGSVSIPIPDLPTHDDCIQTCEVRSEEIDTRVNLDGNVSENRNSDTIYKKSYRSCEADICPVQSGETIIQSCGCLNEFGKAAAMMQLIRLAGKDMTCIEVDTTSK